MSLHFLAGGGYRSDESVLHPVTGLPLLLSKDLDCFVHHRKMIGDAVPNGNLPVQVDHSPLTEQTGGIPNQGQAESCTGFEFAASFGYGLVGQGYTGDAAFDGGYCYTAGRAQGRKLMGAALSTRLLDVGCSPALVVDGCRTAGVPTRAAHPYDAASMDGAELDLQGAVDGEPRAGLIVDAYSTIEEAAGPDLDQAVKQALFSGPGRRVSLALYASAQFQSANGLAVLSAGPVSTVNHMTGVVAYFTVVSVTNGVATLSNMVKITAPNAKVNDTIWLIATSWGTGFSAGNPLHPGMVFVDSSFLYQCAFFGMVDVRMPS